MDKKKIPIGIFDFKKLIENDFYYIDKSLLIGEVLEKGGEVTLITRPRRFGKSLNMSMLKHFFDIREKDSNRKLFDNLNIENTKHMKEFGKYPVIYFSMKDVKSSTYRKFLAKFKEEIAKLYRNFIFLREELKDWDLIKFDKFLYEKEEESFNDGIKFLSILLYEHYGVKPVILIDEYDSPFISAHENGYLDEAKEILVDLYGSGLKNELFSFAVVTGILRLAKESIFSGLNNFYVSTILDGDYNHFGMTENEVEVALKYFNLETTLQETSAWYNGYLFGGSTVYNPWSILNHCLKGELSAFWVNTSANILIKDSLSKASKETYQSLFQLANDGEIVVYIDKEMVLGEHYGEVGLFSLMLFAGYLTVKEKIRDGKYILKIPNYEVKSFFSKVFLSLIENTQNGLVYKLEDALKEGKILGKDGIEVVLANLFENYVSCHDTSKYEIFYHNIILGIMIGFERDYYVSSNVESGHGRYDLSLISKKKNMPSYLFEFKVAKSEKNMDMQGNDALTQIRDKNYKVKFEEKGSIKEIAVIFYKKKLKIYTNEMNSSK